MSKTIGLALAAFGFAAGCAHSTTPPPSPPQAEYRIGKEDVVAVEVWKDPALSAKTPEALKQAEQLIRLAKE